MYLSSLLIDVGENPDRPRPGRMWLRNLYYVHQRLCMAFPSASRKSEDANFLKPFKPEDFGNNHVHVTRSADSGFLFRIDPQPGSRVVILVQSAVKPDWEYAFQNAAYLLAAPLDVKHYDLCFKKGQSLRFRIVANATRKIDTKSKPDGQKRNGKRVPVRNDQFFNWLDNRAKPSGFSIDEGSITIRPGYVYVKKTQNGQGQRLRSVRYEGILIVTDLARFQVALLHGIGAGKAFGFGLLSVAPVSTSGSEEGT
jgi:CRISPR system Cascade subunit CasE